MSTECERQMAIAYIALCELRDLEPNEPAALQVARLDLRRKLDGQTTMPTGPSRPAPLQLVPAGR